MKPIYSPTGRAAEYCDLALNIYTGCNHGCSYCYAPRVLHKSAEDFRRVEPRKNIVAATRNQLAAEGFTGRTIQLCFTCDPYPYRIDIPSPTTQIIRAIKESGNHVQILTKGATRAMSDIDLLDEHDSFGVTITGPDSWIEEHEPQASSLRYRLIALQYAKERGVKTWVSFEPVLYPHLVYTMITTANYIDTFKIGKLNHQPSNINWGEFGRECERLCQMYGRNYYLKHDLRAKMAV